MEEVQSTEEAEEQPSSTVNIQIDSVEMLEELTLTLTRGQLTVIDAFMKTHIQPKGYEMIQFAYDLFSRFNEALKTEDEDSDKEAF